MLNLPEFENKNDLLEYLVKNKSKLIATKKAMFKCADAFSFGSFPVLKSGEQLKANTPITEDVTELNARVVINTTNLMDSYGDVHLDGLWKKTLKENKDIFHDQEHKHAFDSTISDYENLKAYTQSFTWKELGQKWEGKTEALVFDSVIKESRNPFMFEQYKSGHVRNHSVGMQYVKIELAVNNPKWADEFEIWEKYIDRIANKEDAEEQGYFWAVTEAKAIEGSAVKRGANWVTPTLDNNKTFEPEKSTQSNNNEPPDGTQQKSNLLLNLI